MLTLDELRPGETGVIAALGGARAFRVRLMEIGLVPGTQVACVGVAPLGDPVRYSVRDAIVGVRRADARNVTVDRS